MNNKFISHFTKDTYPENWHFKHLQKYLTLKFVGDILLILHLSHNIVTMFIIMLLNLCQTQWWTHFSSTSRNMFQLSKLRRNKGCKAEIKPKEVITYIFVQMSKIHSYSMIGCLFGKRKLTIAKHSYESILFSV